MPDNNAYTSGIAMVKIDGSKVRRLRETRELTQLYVATVVGVTTDTISRWENRRYPTIKKENAVKLAEALEVTLEEILEPPETDSTADQERQQREDEENIKQGLRRFSDKKHLLLLCLAIFAGAAILAGWWYTITQEVNVTARRILPPHVTPGQPFPVIIEVTAKSGNSFSLILKESVPPGCVILQGVPPFTAADSETGSLKWIWKVQGNKTLFAYMTKTDPKIDAEAHLEFSGSLTLRKGQGLIKQIKGDEFIEPANFHWADTNKDSRINDDEILIFYDMLSSIEGFDFGQDKIEEIWASSGYRWDEIQQQYIVLP